MFSYPLPSTIFKNAIRQDSILGFEGTLGQVNFYLPDIISTCPAKGVIE